MTQDDELQRFRRDLEGLVGQAEGMMRRLEVLERRAQAPVITPAETGPSGSAVPPPLPAAKEAPVAGLAKEAVPPRAAPPEPASAPPLPRLSGPPPLPREARPQPAPLAAGLFDKAQKRLAEEGWEVFITTYLFPRIAIVALSGAVVFLMVLAASKSTPLTRVAFGYVVCAALLGLGRWLEGKYQAYARVLYSGGITLSYFVTFAAHYIEPARVVHSTPVALALLAAVVAAWAVVAQVRRSRIVAVLVTGLGHLTIFLAILESGAMANFAVAGVLILSVGSAFFLLRNRWYYVAVLGLAGSYINHTVWMLKSHGAHTPAEFWMCMLVLSGYFFIFSLSELFCAEDLRRKRIPTWFRTAYVTANSASFFALGTLTVAGFDYSKGHQDLFRFVYGFVLLLVALGYLRLRERDPLYNSYFTKAVAMITFAIATRYGGYTLTAWLAVESVALLYSARRSGLVVTRVLAFLVAALTVGQGCYVAVQAGFVAYDAPLYLRHLVPAVITVLALYLASLLYQRTDWSIRAPETIRAHPDTQVLLWQLDLISRAPKETGGAPKPFEGLFFPYVYALAGAGMTLVHTYYLAEAGHRFAVIGALVLTLTLLAGLLSTKAYGLAALVLAAAALMMGTVEIGVDKTAPALAAALGLAAFGTAAVRADKRLFADQPGLAFHQLPAAPYFLYGTAAWLLGLLFWIKIAGYFQCALALIAAAAVGAGLVLVLHPRSLAVVATGLTVWAAVAWNTGYQTGTASLWHPVAAVLVMAALGGDRYFDSQSRRLGTPAFGYALAVIAWAVASRYAWLQSTADWRGFWECGVGFAFLGYALGFRSVAAGIAAVAGVALASLNVTQHAYATDMTLAPLLCGFGALAAFWITCERLTLFARATLFGVTMNQAGGVCTGVATLLLVIMLHRVPALAEYFLTISWSVLAFALFGVSLALRQKSYRYAGVAVFFLAIGRATYDATSLEGLYRVAALGFLGVVLLIVGFGYVTAVARLVPRDKPSSLEERAEEFKVQAALPGEDAEAKH